MLAWLRKPVIDVSTAHLVLIVATGFVVLHLFLAVAVDLYVDHDEMQYGQIAVLMLDGLSDHIRWERPNNREGFPLLFGPLVTPFFALLGANVMTLRIAYVAFASAWAAAWTAVARRLAPHARVWAVAGLFILPTPFISRYVTSSTAMSTHLGVSTAHGLAVLLLLVAGGARDTLRRLASVLAAGVVAGLGTYGGLLMAVLIPSVVLGAAIVAGAAGVATVIVGMLPGLGLAFLNGSPFVAFDNPSEYVGLGFDLREPLGALMYAPGFLPPRSWVGNYLPAGVAYFGLIAAAWFATRRVQAERTAPMLWALLVSAACLLGAFALGHHTPWGRTRWEWDSLRYAAPLLPIAVVLLLASCSRMARAGHRGATVFAATLLVMHAVGFASHVSIRRLFDERISTAWIRPYLRFDPLRFPIAAFPASKRHDHYALREGMAAFTADGADAVKLAARAQSLDLGGGALLEYWRGVGRAEVFWRMNDSLWTATRGWDLGAGLHEAVWQGIGMEAHLADFEHRSEGLDRLLPGSRAERDAYAWGWTRVCTDDAHVPPLVPGLEIDRRLGRRLRWDLDVAVAGAPPVTDDELKTLVFKQWIP
jgi:hypothetical protein